MRPCCHYAPPGRGIVASATGPVGGLHYLGCWSVAIEKTGLSGSLTGISLLTPEKNHREARGLLNIVDLNSKTRTPP